MLGVRFTAASYQSLIDLHTMEGVPIKLGESFMRRLFICFGLVAIIVSFAGMVPRHSLSTINAQSPDPEWRYAVKIDEEQLVAYNLEGEVNVLLELEQFNPIVRIRFADNNALLGLRQADGTVVYYHLTPQSAEVVEMDAARRRVIQTDRYAVLSGDPQIERSPLVLYNAETRQAETLQGFATTILPPIRCCGFSADGQILRYLSFEAADSEQWSVIERRLDTGEERVFYTPDVVFDEDLYWEYLVTDSHGERWVWDYYDNEAEQVNLILVHSDGSSEVRQNRVYDEAPAANNGFLGDFYVERPLACETGCEMLVQAADGEGVNLQGLDHHFLNLIRLNEDQFVGIGGETWLLSTDAEPQFIGAAITSAVSVQNFLSPDKRWITLLDDVENPTTLCIWDTSTQTRVLEIPLETGVEYQPLVVRYSPYGQIISMNQENQRTHVGFEYATGNSITYPLVESEYRDYNEILADGSVLFLHNQLEPSMNLGIWRYDPVTGDISPVLEGNVLSIVFPPIP